MIEVLQRVRFNSRRLSSVLAYLAPVGAVCGTAAAYVLGFSTFAIVSLYATVPAVFASGIHFIATDSTSRPTATVPSVPAEILQLSVAVFFFLHAGSIAVAATGSVRPIAYYVLVALTAGVVLFQILNFDLNRANVGVFLLEASSLVMTIVWSVTLKYHYFFARTDVFPQHYFVQSLLQVRHVTEAFGEYQAFPLWHILVGFETLLFDSVVDPLTLMFVTVGVLFGIATVAVYATSIRFGFSRQIGLIAALSMCLHPFTILYGMYAIPRSVTSVLLLFCVLLLLVEGLRSSVLYATLIVGIAIYHTVSLPFIFVILFVFFVVERVLVVRENIQLDSQTYVVNVWHLIAIPAVQVAYWGIAAPELIIRIINLAIQNSDPSTEAPPGGFTAGFIESPWHELVNYLPFGFLLLFVLFAAIRMPQTERLSRRTEAVLFSAVALSVLSFPGPILLLSVVSDVTPDNLLRFAQYTYPFILMAFSAGVITATKTRTTLLDHRAEVAIVVILVCGSVFVGVSNDFVASDNPLVERDDFYTFYLSEPETRALESLATSTETPVTSDYVACRYIDNPGGGECEIIQASALNEELHVPPDSVLVIRTRELANRPLSIYPTSEPVANPPYSNNRESLPAESPVWETLDDQHRVYDSPEVTGYLSAGRESRDGQ